MIRLLAVLFIFLYSGGLKAQSLPEIRLAYGEARYSRETAEQFARQLEAADPQKLPVLPAYQAAADILIARYMPLTERLSRIRPAISKLEALLDKDPDNPELRFIRLTIQEHLPKIVGYHRQIPEDRKYLEETVSKLQDKSLQEMIHSYFRESREGEKKMHKN